jgi:outer membrane protein assembly factor BamB
MKIITGTIIIGILCILTLSECNQSGRTRSEFTQDWPYFRGPKQNGISDETLIWPEKGPKQVWKKNVSVGYSAVSVVDELAYTMGNKNDTDMVFCLNAKTGAEIWKYSYSCEATYFPPKPFDGPGATPTVYQGVVYTFSRSGHVFALDALTGTVIWKHNVIQQDGAISPQWGFSGSPLLDGNRVILNATNGGICLDRNTGATLWKTGILEGGYASPVPIMRDGRKYVVIFGTQTVTVVDPADGSVLWETKRPQPIGLNAADPVVDGTSLFVSAGRNSGGARYDIAGDTVPVWDNKNMSNHWQSCVLWKGYIYGCDGNQASGAGRSPISLRCIDWKTGNIMWENKKIDFFGLIVVDSKLLMITDSGDLIAADASPSGYNEIGRSHVLEKYCFTAPVIVNGYVYVRNSEGDLVCLDMQP